MQLEAELSHPRARVWRALTDRKLLNAWFQPVDSGWKVSPNEDLPSFAPFELELAPAEQTVRLLWRWHGKDFFSEAEWELTTTDDGGCKLSLRQTGFLGSQEAARRKELLNAYQIMLDRLRAVLDTLAEGGGALGSLTPRPEPEPDGRRVGLLSIAGAVVIVVMIASALAVWVTNGGAGPGGSVEGDSSLGSGTQPGQSQTATMPRGSSSVLPTADPAGPNASASPAVASSPAPSGSVSARPATATYRTTELPEGGFDTEVTVRVGTQSGWTVVLTMPTGNRAENRSAGVVDIRQEGKAVTVTPVSTAGEVTFVIRYAGANAGKSLSGCTVDGQPCRTAGSTTVLTSDTGTKATARATERPGFRQDQLDDGPSGSKMIDKS